MAQTNFTPISLYYSATASNVPTAGNLVAGELAINTADGKLFYKDSAGVVQTIASKATGTVAGSTTQVIYNNAGAYAGSANFVFDGTNVGIGTSSPAQKLDIASAGKIYLRRTDNATGTTINNGGAGVGLLLNDLNAEGYTFQNNGTGVMRIDGSGNVGIGIAPTASEKFAVKQTAATQQGIWVYASANDSEGRFFCDGSSVGLAAAYSSTGSYLPITFTTSATERMRIDTSGNLLVGTTNTNPVGNRVNGNFVNAVGGLNIRGANGNTALGLNVTSGTHINFYTDNGSSLVSAGTITSNGSVTAYNVTSDYRLKENIVPLQNCLSKILQLKPCSYNYIQGNQYSEGFIAHELQAIVPECVTGEKDAMRTEQYEISPAIPAEIDEDGKVIKEAVEAVMGEREVPEYQGIDTSFLIATLTAAIQELNAKVTALETQLATKG